MFVLKATNYILTVPLTQRLSYGEVRAAINKAVTEGVAGGSEALS